MVEPGKNAASCAVATRQWLPVTSSDADCASVSFRYGFADALTLRYEDERRNTSTTTNE